ncbi:hypothetical protein OJ967_12120 [Peribacillus frigoritolerans]|uniref:hypothetical protein n=1 Tax=Peribacillus frigoritolerans TaxID=450367 RepID=UPI00222716A7|nr:hypothetical protein [Peribacillus frigoritolerans]UYZ01171.1 hypothetical protein OJ967_12120 [Peribacillus frigoritolerans]
MSIFKKKIIRHDSSEEYKDLWIAAQNEYPENYLRQLKYVKEKGTKQQYALFLAQTLQYVSSSATASSIKLNLTSGHIDLLSRSLLDALRHMQEDLPDEVYDYNIYNIEDVVQDVIKQVGKQPID